MRQLSWPVARTSKHLGSQRGEMKGGHKTYDAAGDASRQTRADDELEALLVILGGCIGTHSSVAARDDACTGVSMNSKVCERQMRARGKDDERSRARARGGDEQTRIFAADAGKSRGGHLGMPRARCSARSGNATSPSSRRPPPSSQDHHQASEIHRKGPLSALELSQRCQTRRALMPRCPY